MRIDASSSISHEKTQLTPSLLFSNSAYFTFTFSGPSGLCGSTLKWKQSVVRLKARRVRDVASSVSTMNRLNQKSSVFKMWMLYFQRITFSDYFVRNGDMHQSFSFEKDAGYFFFQTKLYLQLFRDNQKKMKNNLRLLHSVNTLISHLHVQHLHVHTRGVTDPVAW